jgi:hypothetical protein
MNPYAIVDRLLEADNLSDTERQALDAGLRGGRPRRAQELFRRSNVCDRGWPTGQRRRSAKLPVGEPPSEGP